MDGEENLGTTKQNNSDPESFPSLFRLITSRPVAGFDITSSPQGDPAFAKALDPADGDIQDKTIIMLSPTSPIQMIRTHHAHSISISMPSSPSAFQVEHSRGVLESESGVVSLPADGQTSNPMTGTACIQQQKKTKFHSQPMPARNFNANETSDIKFLNPFEHPPQIPRNSKFKDKRYDSFKTWSGKLERQISNLRGKPPEIEEANDAKNTKPEAVPANRFFDALEGPELDKLKATEELVLPEDKKWPFLLRFPVSSFGICLGVSSQAILWKTLTTSPSTNFLHIGWAVNLVMWCISVALIGIVSAIYVLKIIFYFEAVRREYYHPIRVNFFFAPWISCLFLAIGAPPSVAINLHAAVWYVLMAPIFLMELKIYGQWMSGGQRRLSKVANPSNHLSIAGNFVGALLGASMGLKEGPIFFFAIGLAHYAVLFVTLYQRLPTNETLPKELHPVFFLFVAAPSVACMAWANITGDFGYGSRIIFFIALFLYASLAVRINFFRGFRFSLAWWAYTFPMTSASIATIRYSAEVTNVFTRSLSVALSAVSAMAVVALLGLTVLHAFVRHDLFPNDISIAISGRPSKRKEEQAQARTTSSPDDTDIEAGVSADSGGDQAENRIH